MTVAGKKKLKNRTARFSFKLGSSKRKIRLKKFNWPSLIVILKVLAATCVFVAIGIGFVFLLEYVRKTSPVSGKKGIVKLVNPPAWLNEQLKEKVYAAATAKGEDLKLDDDAARSIENNLSQKVAWLDDIQVETTHDSFYVKAHWRKPLALIKTEDDKSCYVDADLVVLDFVPVASLPIVSIKGLSDVKKLPSPGSSWRRDDLAAAVELLVHLNRRDTDVAPAKPLLYEIAQLDISNFNGRRNSGAPHIVLYATDNTEIIWGAEVGKWQRYLEAKDEDKLAKLYDYYKKCGSLLRSAQYIDLRYPQNGIIPLPIDKY